MGADQDHSPFKTRVADPRHGDQQPAVQEVRLIVVVQSHDPQNRVDPDRLQAL
jgi:hypothetical protein